MSRTISAAVLETTLIIHAFKNKKPIKKPLVLKENSMLNQETFGDMV